jgi:hypothetical protein
MDAGYKIPLRNLTEDAIQSRVDALVEALRDEVGRIDAEIERCENDLMANGKHRPSALKRSYRLQKIKDNLWNTRIS